MKILHVGFGFRPFRQGGLIAYAEDLMDAQIAAGYEVGYFFVGRHYPFLERPRLKRWARRRIRMYELVNSPLQFGGDRGTAYPEQDVSHPEVEAVFSRVVRDAAPDVIHIQELLGLPSSVIDVAHSHGRPVVMTLNDYLPLCPTIKLFDADGAICLRRSPGDQCARCCADAPTGAEVPVWNTTSYEAARVIDTIPGLERVPRPRKLVTMVKAVADRLSGGPGEPAENRSASPEAYQRRRDLNVEQLSRLDLMLASSQRVADIYAQLGVRSDKIRVQTMTLRQLESARPKVIRDVPLPVHFATSNGCASTPKGREVVIGALHDLEAAGLAAEFRLSVLGFVAAEDLTRLSRFPSVEYVGLYDPSELDTLLADVSVGIVPSIWEEVYGLVGPEFLARGIPVIGNNIGGIPEYTVDGVTGWLNRDCSAEGLACVMEQVIRDPASVARLNATILKNRERFVPGIDTHRAEIDSAYSEAVATHVRSATC